MKTNSNTYGTHNGFTTFTEYLKNTRNKDTTLTAGNTITWYEPGCCELSTYLTPNKTAVSSTFDTLKDKVDKTYTFNTGWLWASTQWASNWAYTIQPASASSSFGESSGNSKGEGNYKDRTEDNGHKMYSHFMAQVNLD